MSMNMRTRQPSQVRTVFAWALWGWLTLGAIGATAETNLFHHEEGAAERRRQMMQQIREQMEAEQEAAAAALAEAEAAHTRRNRFPEINELSRYITTIVLFLTGLLLVANPVAECVPALDPVVDKVLPAAPFMGLAAMLVGGLDLVLDLVSFRWVGDTLPVLLLVVGGLTALRAVRVLPAPSPSAAADDGEPRSTLHRFTEDTVQNVQRALQRKPGRALLERLALPIGIFCILAAVAHWMAGDLMVL